MGGWLFRAYDSVSEARTSIGRYLDFITTGDRIRTLTARPRLSLLQRAADPHGSLTPADASLIDAEILFRQPGPSLNITALLC